MVLTWFALIDTSVWHERSRGNPFASMQALWSDLRWLVTQEESRRTLLPRTLQVRRALEAFVRTQCHAVLPFSGSAPLSSMVRYELAEPAVIAATAQDASFDLVEIGAIPPGALTHEMADVLTEQCPGLGAVWTAATEQRCGLVIGADVYQGGSGVMGTRERFPSLARRTAAPLKLRSDALEGGSEDRHWLALAEAATAGQPWSPGHLPDASVCELLWRLSANAVTTGELLVRFQDGTMGVIPITPGRTTHGTVNSTRLRLISGLMSLRHSLIDSDASFYWFRNETLSSADRMADAAHAASREAGRTLELLGMLANGRPLAVDVFLTGFHPAVIGLLGAIQAVPPGLVDLVLVPLAHQGTRRPVRLAGWEVPGT